MRDEELKGHLDALLLAAQGNGPPQGYAVIDRLCETTGGRLEGKRSARQGFAAVSSAALEGRP
jgi:hypothetical protein